MTRIETKYLINWLILLSLTIVPFVFIPVGEFNDYFYAPKVDVLTIFALSYILILLYDRKNIFLYVKKDKINFILFIYVSILFLSLFFARNLNFAILGRQFREEGFSTLLIYFVLFLAARSSIFSEKLFFMSIFTSAMVLSFYGIIQYFGLDPFPRDFIRVNWQTSFSTFGNPNFLASYLVLVILFPIHFYFVKNNKFCLIVYSVILFCLLCTKTRGAWIGTSIAFIIYFFIMLIDNKSYKTYLFRFLIVILVSSIIIISFNIISDGVLLKRFLSIFIDVKEVITNGDNSDRAGSFRFFIWKRVIEMIIIKPIFGYGIENLMEPFVMNFENDMLKTFGYILPVDKAHNEYLNIAVSSGVPSLIVYLFLVFNILKVGLSKLANSKKYWPFFASIIGYLIQAFFNISVVSVAFIFWIFLGLLCNYEEKNESQKISITNN